MISVCEMISVMKNPVKKRDFLFLLFFVLVKFKTFHNIPINKIKLTLK